MRKDPFTESVGPEPAPDTPTAQLHPGSVVGDRFRIERVLGTGGFSVVYAAHDRILDRRIALKVLRSDRSGATSLKRFVREVRLAREIDHPHLVKVWDIGESDGMTWISMELIEGETLLERIRRGIVPIDEAVKISKQILRALESLHARGIVHRDVKPGNVLVTQDGDIRLADLGLARYRDPEEDASRVTSTGHIVGTFAYVSPEQALGKDPDPRSDLYSFGVLLFELLTGRLPFDSGSSVSAVIAHMSKPSPDVRAFREDIPRWLSVVVARLLEKRRQHRYRSATEVLRDLEHHRTNRLFVLRKTAPRIAFGILLVLLVTAGVFGWLTWKSSRFSEIREVPGGGIQAVDQQGNPLWSRSSLEPRQYTTARLQPGGSKSVVVVVEEVDEFSTREHRLEILDAQDGSVVRSVSLEPRGTFFQFSRTFWIQQVASVDLNHDEVDEVVMTFHHIPAWPCYVLYYDPLADMYWTTLLASGHHHLIGTADVNGDGRDELIFQGINNRMGWYQTLAAVSPVPIGSRADFVRTHPAASTPDAEYSPSPRSVLPWYVLTNTYELASKKPVLDRENERILFEAGNQLIAVGFDGFLESHDSDLSPELRIATRRESYANLREGQRIAANEDPERALISIGHASELAREANDPILTEWIERVEGQTLVQAGQFQKGELHFEALVESSDAGIGVSWEAATAFHREGELERALNWYERGIRERGKEVHGRRAGDFLIHSVLVLGELGRWQDARQLANLFFASDGQQEHIERNVHAWISWRDTGHVEGRPEVYEGDIDLFRYLDLEYRLASGEDPRVLLPALTEQQSVSSDTDLLLRTLKAELLSRTGDTDRALVVARDAWRDALVERRDNLTVRAFFDLATQRYASIADSAGHPEEAKEARRTLDKFWGS